MGPNSWMIIPIAAAILAGVTLAIAFATYIIAFYNKHKKSFNPFFPPHRAKSYPFVERSNALITALIDEPCETLEITARDGKRLAGRYYHRADGAPLDIMFHGYMSGALHDFPGGAIEALRAGHNVLLVDQRGHGGSHGRTVSFGIKERYDCVDWANFAVERFGNDTRIILVGISMGAATVLYASELELPPEVRGIVADCPYSSAEKMIKKSTAEMGLPAEIAFPFVRLGGRIFGGFDVCERTVLEAVRGAKLPLLLYHGIDDGLVPYDMSLELSEAYGGEAELLLFEGAGHGTSYLVDTDRYVGALGKFYEKVLKTEEASI